MSTRTFPLVSLCLLVVLVLVLRGPAPAGAQGTPPAGGAARPARTVELVPAELAGMVRDSAGTPLRDAEVIAPAIGRSTRTDADGKFLLAGVVPGLHEVWIRHIGYTSTPFDWQADEGKRVEIAVTLRALPHTLDPVVVYGRETRSLNSSSSLTGVVVDSSGVPVANADLQLLGAARSTVTKDDGSFEFRHVPPGSLTLRARHLGFAPVALTVDMKDDDQRSISLRLRRLAVDLDAVVVEASGYGTSDDPWREYDLRSRWISRSGDAQLITSQMLMHKGKMGLDLVLAPYAVIPMSRAPTVMDPRGVQMRHDYSLTADDACVLENGKTPRQVPLSYYDADEVDRIEYYPPGKENTNTVESRMSTISGCGRNLDTGHLPPYFVVWLKNAR